MTYFFQPRQAFEETYLPFSLNFKCAEFGTNIPKQSANVKQMNRPRNIVGPVVRALREKKGLTQAELAAKLNLLGWDLSRDTLAKIESQMRWVADFEILKLAASLEMEGPELLRRAASQAKT